MSDSEAQFSRSFAVDCEDCMDTGYAHVWDGATRRWTWESTCYSCGLAASQPTEAVQGERGEIECVLDAETKGLWCRVHDRGLLSTTLTAEVADMLRGVIEYGMHIHQAPGDGTDRCKRCGHDIRHIIHQRFDPTLREAIASTPLDNPADGEPGARTVSLGAEVKEAWKRISEAAWLVGGDEMRHTQVDDDIAVISSALDRLRQFPEREVERETVCWLVERLAVLVGEMPAWWDGSDWTEDANEAEKFDTRKEALEASRARLPAYAFPAEHVFLGRALNHDEDGVGHAA